MDKFNVLVAKLSLAGNTDAVNVLELIAELLGSCESHQLATVIESSDLILILANTLNQHPLWATSSVPAWVEFTVIQVYSSWHLKVPIEQTKSLVEAFKTYLEVHKTKEVILLVARVATALNNRQYFLNDFALYNIIKSSVKDKDEEVANMAIKFFINITDTCPEWQVKILRDYALISDLLSLPENEDAWALLANLSTHPDAKEMLPGKVLTMAARSSLEACTDICAILCSEATANTLKLPQEYIEDKAERLAALLEIQTQVEAFFPFSLLDLVLPLVNLSVVDANKEIMGQRLVKLLLKIIAIQEEEPLISNISECLTRSKQEAAKTLWDLAFTVENRKRIEEVDGVITLEMIKSQTRDIVLRTNVEGVLYMFAQRDHKPEQMKVKKRHVMLSYNWANQPIVLKLAQALKANGIEVWLDVEQMAGSTLDAMAAAVEGSELVLMCMSQKYKDSPNCRLEGEYCINSKIPFIPLMMQQGYQPDGWLGLALGSKLWYPFWDEGDWDSKITGLLKGVSNVIKRSLSKSTELVLSHTTVREARGWKEQEVLAWMQAEGILQHQGLFVQHKLMDGRALMELKTLLSASQPLTSLLLFFRDWMGIQQLGDMLLISAALRKL